MSHTRSGEGRIKHKMSACRKGRHNYGEPQSIGAGIVRQVCRTCAAVTIDLTAVSDGFDVSPFRSDGSLSSRRR